MNDNEVNMEFSGMEPEAWDSRTERLIGRSGVERLSAARVLIVGVGGVGGYVAEMLARSGVGHLALMDSDKVAESNLNRQIIALRSTIGMPKTELFRKRIADINPAAEVTAIEAFLEPDMVGETVGKGRDKYDVVIDAIDTVAPKVALIAWCQRNGVRLLSSMGAGGRMDPSKVHLADLWETRDDGLARAVRSRLKKIGLRRPLKVVASSEVPHSASLIELDLPNKRSSFGTVATIPSIFGIYLAAEAIRLLTLP